MATQLAFSGSLSSGVPGPFQAWMAVADFSRGAGRLHVRGEYRLGPRSASVRLVERRPAGTNPAELVLDLAAAGDGAGGEWFVVEGAFAAREGQYRTVRVVDIYGDQIVFKVEETR